MRLLQSGLQDASKLISANSTGKADVCPMSRRCNGLIAAGVLESVLWVRRNSPPRLRVLGLPLTLAVLIGSLICVPLVAELYSPAIYGAVWKLATAVPLISACIAAISCYLRLLLIAHENRPATDISSSGDSRLWLPVRGGLQAVPPHDIHHISARRPSSVLHTAHGDRQAAPALGEVMQRLQALGAREFVRAHRSFILNVERVDRLEHLGGGVYRATLSDAAESEVPVGRRFVAALRERLS